MRPNSSKRAKRALVFIAFKSEDLEIARRLKRALELQNFGVYWQENLECGEEWHGEIERALAEAGCIVVLWSARSRTSRWVCHEASQAMARGVYAPVRIELVNIQSPFNRLQATDLNDWSGDHTHPGFCNLLQRVETLLPRSRPWWRRMFGSVGRNWPSTLALSISAGTILLLAQLAGTVEQQVGEIRRMTNRQDLLGEQVLTLAESAVQGARDANRSLRPLTKVDVNLSLSHRTRIISLDVELYKLEAVDWAKRNGEIFLIGQSRSDWVSLFALRGLREPPSQLAYASWTLAFCRRQVDSQVGKCDLNAADLSGRRSTKTLLQVNTKTETLAASITDAIDETSWAANGDMVSVPDLLAAHFVICVESPWALNSMGLRAGGQDITIGRLDEQAGEEQTCYAGDVSTLAALLKGTADPFGRSASTPTTEGASR